MKKVFGILLALAMGFALCACAPADGSGELVSVEVENLRVRYLEGERVERDALDVYALYADGTRTKVTDFALLPSRALTEEDREVRIGYRDKVAVKKIAVGREPDLSTSAKRTAFDSARKGEFSREAAKFGSAELSYRLRRPDTVNGPSPLVVFLHGSGERGSDNDAQLKNCILRAFDSFLSEMYDCFVLAPQCPAAPAQWVDTPWAAGNYSTSEVAESEPLRAVWSLIEQFLENPEVDTSRVYVIGLSMGGFGAWDLLARHGEAFAAGMPICGGGDPAAAAELAEIPIYTFHGSADKTVPVGGTREMVEAVRAAGGNILYKEFAGMGHGIWDDAISFGGEGGLPAALGWLFSQRRTAE